nr:hypothetical protein L203_03812 [Cryptococcus depauperatus CBS 7841]
MSKTLEQFPNHNGIAEGDFAEYSYNEEQSESQDISEEGWKTLAKIVRDVGPSLVCDEELKDLAAAEIAVNVKDAERAARVDKLRDELRQLTKQYGQAASAAQRPPSHPSPAEHDAQVHLLEQQQYSAGKQLNEEQTVLSKKEVELGGWKAAKEEVAKVEVGEDNWENDKVIRLKLFMEAGISFVPPKDSTSASKVLIRNDAKEDVHSVVIDSSRSKSYTANLIWSLASDQ